MQQNNSKEWVKDASDAQKGVNEILSFEEYVALAEKRPCLECRPSCKYIKDIFEYFGKSPRGDYNLFIKESANSTAVYGQQRVYEHIYQNILNFTEEGFNNKFILLVGPNGSAKTSIVRKLMEGAEEYSKCDNGALYSFSWIFPIESYIKGTLGFERRGEQKESCSSQTYAYLEDREISSILSSELRDHPLLLIPASKRQQMIDTWLKAFPSELETVRKSYLYYGDISKRNRMIYDALLQSYQGNLAEVLKHIRVERFAISKRYSVGAVTIEPQLHVDLRIQQITMDRRLATLPPSLQSLNLFSVQGENAMANRGILEFSDLLKRPLDAFKYLIMTMESRTINLQGILTELDIFFIGSSNEIHLSAFKQHPDYYSFRGRINFIKVPYLLNAEEEVKIYNDQIASLKSKMNFEPHALECLCLWAVMTRLRPALAKNYKDKKLGELVTTLNPLEKALLYSNEFLPARLDSEEKKLLKVSIQDVIREFENENLYEGKFGISPREIKQIIYEISSKGLMVTFVDILDFLNKFIDRKNEHDFLNIAPQGDYANPVRFIELLKDYQLEIFDHELRDSLNLVDDRSYEGYLIRYVQNITSLIKGEKIKSQITGRYEDIDHFFVKEFENNIKLKESPEIFRSHMMTTLGAYSLDHPNKKIVYTEVFTDLVKTLKESFREEQKKVIVNIAKNLVFYLSEVEDPEHKRSSSLSEEGRKEIEIVLEKLQGKYRYSQAGALTLARYLIKEKY
ncbi:MAG: hypothetical protein HQK52_13305 [Oligoflexia bacterium]|nr:hypothetical protein [Oligoflexia bacterium]